MTGALPSLSPRPRAPASGRRAPRHQRSARLAAAAAIFVVAACDAPTAGEPPPDPDLSVAAGCAFTPADLFNGGPGRDGIPSLINPPLVPLDHADAAYMDAYVQQAAQDPGAAEARVVGLVVDGQAIAIPHNILWWHEIVNADLGGRRLAITYCPLTGSALVFDVTAAGTQRFGVSGLIFQNNLVMFDPETETLWPQLCRRAVSGSRAGTELVQVPAIEMHWEAWKARHPNSLIVSAETGYRRDYTRYPYSHYESSGTLLFPMRRGIDNRLPPKERVFGIREGEGGLAFPFRELEAVGPTLALVTRREGQDVLVLWDAAARAAAAYLPETTDGLRVTLRSEGDGFVDAESGTRWDVEGRAIAGPLAGSRLVPFPHAFVAFWFAWAAFQPQTGIFLRE